MSIVRATRLQVRAAVEALTDLEMKGLKRFARWKAVGLVNTEWEDLRQMAILQVLSGERAWNPSTPLAKHLASVIRSLCSAARLKMANNSLSLEALSQNGFEPAAQVPGDLVATSLLAELKRELEPDVVLSNIIDLMAEGLEKVEIQRTLGLSENDFLAAKKRLQRHRRTSLRKGAEQNA